MNVFDALLGYQSRLLATTPKHADLSAKLWVRQVLDALCKAETLKQWKEALLVDDPSDCIGVILAFSGFRGSDKLALDDKMDELAAAVKSRIGAAYLAERPDERELVKRICEALVEEGIAPAGGLDFHRTVNNFVNLVIDQSVWRLLYEARLTRFNRHIPSLPMTLVAIFCAVANRLGLKAMLVGFPQRILCRVSGWTPAAAGEEDEFYMFDIFDGGTVLTRQELFLRLHGAGVPGADIGMFLSPARPSDIVARVARNIFTGLNRDRGPVGGPSAASRSLHAALAALIFFQPNNAAEMLPDLLYQFPMDVHAISHDYSPILMGSGAQNAAAMTDKIMSVYHSILQRDAAPPAARLRESERREDLGDTQSILHHIGTIFRHRRYGYVGVIKKWDPRCCAQEAWMQSNQIDTLDGGGRKQPFYSISADDGSDRYIAQVNVQPMHTVAINTCHRIIDSHDDLGYHFLRADPERGLFVMDDAQRAKYPEDAAWQDTILQRATPYVA